VIFTNDIVIRPGLRRAKHNKPKADGEKDGERLEIHFRFQKWILVWISAS
jgi:hypothetical protein